MLQLLICRRCRYEKTLLVSCRQSPDDPSPGDGCMADWDDILQLGFEDAVEVLGSADGDEGVGVCECREDADSVRMC